MLVDWKNPTISMSKGILNCIIEIYQETNSELFVEPKKGKEGKNRMKNTDEKIKKIDLSELWSKS
jgi:hypothetical protein